MGDTPPTTPLRLRAWAPGPHGGWAVWQQGEALPLGAFFGGAPAAFAAVPAAAAAAEQGRRGRTLGAGLWAGSVGLWVGTGLGLVLQPRGADTGDLIWVIPTVVAGVVAAFAGGALLGAANGQMATAVQIYNAQACGGDGTASGGASP